MTDKPKAAPQAGESWTQQPRPLNERERAVLGRPNPGHFGIPKEHWDAAKNYAEFLADNLKIAAPHRENTYAGMPRHTDSCAVHSPTLRPCSCELETKLKDIITQLRADLKLGVEFGKWKAAPQPSTADFKAAPSHEGVGQGEAAVAATERGELIKQLQERARIRRQIPTRKSVQEGQPDRIADLLERAAAVLSRDSEDADELLRECRDYLLRSSGGHDLLAKLDANLNAARGRNP